MDTIDRSTGPCTGGIEKLSLSPLLDIIKNGSADCIEAPLEDLHRLFLSKSWKQSSPDTLLQTWRVCTFLLDKLDLQPEACARTLHILRALAQYCHQCSTPVFDDWTQLDVGSAVGKVALCMHRHSQSITVQTTGCALLSRLAGCSTCQIHTSNDLIAVLGANGAVKTLASVVTVLQARSAEPASMVCASEILAALRFMTETSAPNVDLVADGGGVVLVQAAQNIAKSHGAADLHALALFTRLACRNASTWHESVTAASKAVSSAVACGESPSTNAALPKVLWGISLVVPALMAKVDMSKVVVDDISGFAQHGAVEAVKYLQMVLSEEEQGDGAIVNRVNKDDDVVWVWLHFLGSLACCTPAPALTAPSTTTLVAALAAVPTQSSAVQSAALCSLYNLLHCCTTTTKMDTTAISANVATALCSLRQQFPHVDGTARPSVAAGLLHGVACLDKVGVPPSLLSSVLELQLAVTTALSVLSTTASSTTSEWDECQVSWVSLSASLRVTVNALLGAGKLNSGDGEGRTLMHHLAASGQSKCLGVVLELAGSDVDVLARTKSGETALQLARQGRHTAAVALLDGVTQRAAEACQAALLEELAMMDVSAATRTKGTNTTTASTTTTVSSTTAKKKKSSGAASMSTDQLQRLACDDVEKTLCGAAAVDEMTAAEQARVELRQRLDEEYERALEQRRQELHAAAVADVTTTTTTATARHQKKYDESSNDDGDSASSSSSTDKPSTPRSMLEAAAPGGENGSSSGEGEGDSSSSGGEGSGGGGSSSVGEGGSSGGEDEALVLPESEEGEEMMMMSVGVGASLFQQQQQGTTTTTTTTTSSDTRSLQFPPLPPTSVFSHHGAVGDAYASHQHHHQQHHHHRREHSLFGSPSLTGDLFTRSTSSSMNSPSKDNHSSSSSSSLMLSSRTTTDSPPPSVVVLPQCLPDALFVHPGLSAAVTNTTANDIAVLHPSPLRHHSAAAPLSSPSSTGLSSPSAGTTIHGSSSFSSSSDGGGDDSNACAEPTRHLWIGNLGTRTPRTLLKSLFETHGVVEDVVTFPGRMYAFVNFCTVEEAVTALGALQSQVLPELTGERPLLMKYRSVKKAAMHLRSFADGGGGVMMDFTTTTTTTTASASAEDSMLSPSRCTTTSTDYSAAMDNINSSGPSPRIWLGNIAPTATSKTLQAVLGRFGSLTDAAVFPARIGPLGYAFVKFAVLEDAVRALDTLNNTVVPPLSGSKQLKMRYKPAASGPSGREEAPEPGSKSTTVPSRHLWLGNITQKPTEDVLFQTFSRFGRVDSARIFPAKAYAFVNYTDLDAAVRAMAEMDGVPIATLTGVKPLVMRFQQETQQQQQQRLSGTVGAAAAAAVPSTSSSASSPDPLAAQVLLQHVTLPRAHHSDSALALAASLALTQQQLAVASSSSSCTSGGLQQQPQHTNYFGRNDSSDNARVLSGWPGDAPSTTGDMYRSASMGLLSAHQHQPPLTSPFGPPSSAVMGMMGDIHQHQGAPTSATASQLTAVLSNLAALQRVASTPAALVGGSSGALITTPSAASLQTPVSGMLVSQTLHSSSGSSINTSPEALQYIHHHHQQQYQQQQHHHHQQRPPMPMMRSAAGVNGVLPTNNTNTHMMMMNGLDALLCPLSSQLMTDPVMAADGVTYHKPAILEWLATRGFSPVTQAPLAHAALVPSPAVKDAVLGYLRMQLQRAAA